MKFFKNCLLFILALLLLNGCVSNPNLQKINLPSNVSSQINNLRDSGMGNIDTIKADRIMKNGFLNTRTEEYGYYTLNMDYRKKGQIYSETHSTYNDIVMPIVTGFFLTVPLILGLPTEIHDFDLTMRLEIFDSNMNTIRSYSDSETITQAAGFFLFFPYGDPTKKANAAYTRLLRNIQQRAAADSTFINTALITAGPIGGRQTVSVPSTPTVPQRQPQQNDIVGALDNAARVIINSLQERNLRNQKIAIVNISSYDREQSVFVAGELEYILVQNRFTIVDRSELDRIRREQNFQLSGDVDDDQIVSIGKFAGAGLVITGSITGSGSMRRLRLRVLDTQSAELRGSASEPF
jgi:hypothetical protein